MKNEVEIERIINSLNDATFQDYYFKDDPLMRGNYHIGNTADELTLCGKSTKGIAILGYFEHEDLFFCKDCWHKINHNPGRYGWRVKPPMIRFHKFKIVRCERE
jgi:hypothetical protein